jgi:hypothetical protein
MRFIVIAICSVVLFFPVYWLFHAVVGPAWGAGIAAVAMYIAFPILAMKVWPAKPTPTTSMVAALEGGSLASADYDVAEVVEVQELEDEGPHFFMDVGGGRTLFLSGQYLDEPVRAGRFPSSRIRVFGMLRRESLTVFSRWVIGCCRRANWRHRIRRPLRPMSSRTTETYLDRI